MITSREIAVTNENPYPTDEILKIRGFYSETALQEIILLYLLYLLSVIGCPRRSKS